MNKTFLIILVILLAIGAFWYFSKEKTAPQNPISSTTSNYRNPNLGISFTYPKILTVKATSDVVSLHHEIPFVHEDFCDFRGEGDTTLQNMTDLNLDFTIHNKNLVNTMKELSPYIPQENFVNGQVVASPGFIDSYSVGEWKGFKIFEGAEGCGQITYYFPVSGSKTLVMKEELISVFSGVIAEETVDRVKAVPGVITREKSIEIIESILKTVKVN